MDIDIDTAPPCLLLLLLPPALPVLECLLFPGEAIDGVHQLVSKDIGPHITRQQLESHCNTYQLLKKGNKQLLTKQLIEFSTNQKVWDGLDIEALPLQGEGGPSHRCREGGTADECVKHNLHYGPKHPLYKPLTPGATMDTITCTDGNGNGGNPPASTVSLSKKEKSQV
ncbi:hypothetical protein V8E53_003574 [Lactarius tabidus]